MATRKPDWAQRMVQRHVGVEDSEPENYRAVMLPAKQVETLLRTHHRKVKRMVLEVGKDFSWSTSVASAIRYILDKLKELEQ